VFADTLITWGENPEAIAQLERVVVLDPDAASAWHDLGILLHDRGDDARAIQALERARALAPNDIRPRRTLAVLHWKRGDRASALAEYRSMLELDLSDQLRAQVQWAIQELSTSP
jgi:Flp pilus assembly protein TadD